MRFTVEGEMGVSVACLVTNRAAVELPWGMVDVNSENNQAEDVDRYLAPLSCPGDVTVECVGEVPVAARDWAQFLAQGGSSPGDCCGSAPTLTHVRDMSNGGSGCAGSPLILTMVYRLTSGCNDAVECRQTITVQDTTPPLIVCPPDLTVQRWSRVPAADPGSVSASDNCSTPTVRLVSEVVVTNISVLTLTRTYVVSDACGNSASCAQRITIDPAYGAPVAVNDGYAVDEDGQLNIAAPGVLGNDSDPDGDRLTAVLVTGPAHGTLTLNPDGSFTYTPEPNYHGLDSFCYQANDGAIGSGPATVTIDVSPVNDACFLPTKGGCESF